MANGAVDVLVAFGGDVGTCVVNRASRLILKVSPTRESTKVVGGSVGATGPFLGCHIGQVESDRLLGLGAQVVSHGVENALLAFLSRKVPHLFCVNVGDKSHQSAVGVFFICGRLGKILAVVGVVVDLLNEAAATKAGAGESFFAPERGVIDGVHLDNQAHRDVLMRNLLVTRHWGNEGDAAV